jgi:hypothetical protein
MPRRNRIWSSVLAGALLAGLVGCGGDTPTGFGPSPTPTPCTQKTVDQSADSIDSFNVLYYDFPVPDGGRLDVTLDWTFAESRLAFYLVPANTCTLDELNKRTCNFLIRSEPSTAKPKKVSMPNVAAGNYRWIIGNAATVSESFSLLIVQSNGSCAALAGAPPVASGQAQGPWPAFERMSHR